MPFNITDNITAIMGQLFKVAEGTKTNNLAPTYIDGAMLANDAEFFLYGGLSRKTDAYTPQDADEVLSYQLYQYGVQKNGFLPGPVQKNLPEGLTRYLAYGGSASAPSENKAWYFSGMHSPIYGDIFQPSLNDTINAINVSNTLITLDMTTQQQEKWSNVTLPPLIQGRANPDLVWVPVGEQGILVALGGVVFPEFATSAHFSTNEAQSEADSPVFMSTIDIYDVAGNKWYQQPTTGGPGALTRGCAVVAPAQDSSSFNIYYYGGYDGLHPTAEFNDDVWVLSLPSFKWTKLAEGKAEHGRAGHKCFMPYPDQMMIIGGYPSMPGSPVCLNGGIIQLFNLSAGTWMTEYDPMKWSNYSVPDAVLRNVGGSPTGGATATTPGPSGWATAALGQVFATAYPATRIKKYYPYSPAQTKNNTNPSVSEVPQGGSGTPKYLAPLLGTIFGLMFITLVITGIFLWRRRNMLKRNPSDFGTEDSNGHRIMSWIRGQPALDHKSTTITTDDTLSSPGVETPPVLPHPAFPAMTEVMHHEAPDTQIAELMGTLSPYLPTISSPSTTTNTSTDTSPRAELSDTGLSPVDIINRHSRLGHGHSGSLNNPSNYSSTIQTDHASTISHPSGLSHPPLSPQDRPNRPDSPSLGSRHHELPSPPIPVSPPEPSPTEQNPMDDPRLSRITSGVSSVSDRDRAHLRQISDATVSSAGSQGDSRVLSVVDEAVTPPATSVGFSERGMGVGALGESGTSRRSIFRESVEDMGNH